MATGQERRAGLLNERLRGAQRTNVEDESFSIDIGGFGGEAKPASPARQEGRSSRLDERLRGAQRTNIGDESFSINVGGPTGAAKSSSPARREPQASAKRRRRDSDEPSDASRNSGSTIRQRRRAAGGDVYDLPETSKESDGQVAAAQSPAKQRSAQLSPEMRRVQKSSVARSTTSPQEEEERDELVDVPTPSSVRLPTSARSPALSRIQGGVVEEVEESPADAPGSGRRRSVRTSGAASSTARLQGALNTDDAGPPSSSPLARKAQRSDASVATRRSTIPRRERSDEADELSPDRPQATTTRDEEGELSESHPVENLEDTVAEPDMEARPERVEASEEEEAEEIDATQAAKTLFKKRPRGSMRAKSLELGSGDVEDEQEAENQDAQEDEQPLPKRRRGGPSKSPAQQKQPAPKSKSNAKAKQGAKRKDPSSKRRQSDDSNDAAIEITVQRFVNNKAAPADADDIDAPDPLQSQIPFANRSGESVVDVFAQVCDEVIASTLEQFRQMGEAAGDVAKKKECRVKMRAIEAYREELSTRLLQHTIHLNHWHSLRKRVRHVQKEKMSLREEIIRLKGEREQVALQMDAVRIKHETDSKDSTYRLNASALMHDIDLAVEQGREAPELSGAVQKQAELGNLELLMSRVAEEASSTSFTGGMLSQVKDFNALLERAAAALESR